MQKFWLNEAQFEPGPWAWAIRAGCQLQRQQLTRNPAQKYLPYICVCVCGCLCVGVRARLCRTLAIHNFSTCHIFYYVSRAVDILWVLFYFYYNRRVCACLCKFVRVSLQATTSWNGSSKFVKPRGSLGAVKVFLQHSTPFCLCASGCVCCCCCCLIRSHFCWLKPHDEGTSLTLCLYCMQMIWTGTHTQAHV